MPKTHQYPNTLAAVEHALACVGAAILHQTSLDKTGLVEQCEQARVALKAAVALLLGEVTTPPTT